MRKVIYAMSVSLDGYIETISGDLSWSYPSPELHQHFNDQEAAIDTYLYGRRLYENMVEYWPTADEDPAATDHVKEYARIWKAKKKIIFSKTLTNVGWNSRLFMGNITEEINKLKGQPGLDMSVGGANLAGIFMQCGLIDEYRLYFHPVILGCGKPMFPDLRDRIDLNLLETRTFDPGVVMIRLEKF